MSPRSRPFRAGHDEFIFAYVKDEVNCKGVAERENVIRFIGFAGGRCGGVRSSLDTFVADPTPMASCVGPISGKL